MCHKQYLCALVLLAAGGGEKEGGGVGRKGPLRALSSGGDRGYPRDTGRDMGGASGVGSH
jgi:hypothetical protein